MPVRDSRRTGWPTASIVRRTMRFRPSCNVILTSVFSPAVETTLTDVGPDRAVLERDALPQPLQRRRGRPRPATSAR